MTDKVEDTTLLTRNLNNMNIELNEQQADFLKEFIRIYLEELDIQTYNNTSRKILEQILDKILKAQQ